MNSEIAALRERIAAAFVEIPRPTGADWVRQDAEAECIVDFLIVMYDRELDAARRYPEWGTLRNWREERTDEIREALESYWIPSLEDRTG